MNDEEIILDNLKELHHGKWVNTLCAIHHTSTLRGGFQALQTLMSNHKISRKEVSTTDRRNRKVRLELFRCSLTY